MKQILALDMATKTGWSTNSTSGVEDFRKNPGDSRGMIFIRFEAWLNEMVSLCKPDVIVYERPHARGRAANEVLNGMLAFLVKACEVHGIQYTDCPSTTLKSFATGKGNASKEMMMQAYRTRWAGDPIDDNHADACWLLAWANSQFN